MSWKSLGKSSSLASLLLGLAGVALVAVGHGLGLDHRAELHALDLRFRHCSRTLPPEDIVHIDIDDRSLAEVGRWPWPRQTLAALLQVLHAGGARTVALDIILPEPQPVRYESASGDIHDPESAELIGRPEPVPVFDDKLLAEAILQAGNVCLPMHVDFSGPAQAPLEAKPEEVRAAPPAPTGAPTTGQTGLPPESGRSVLRQPQELLEARVAAVLARQPQADLERVLTTVLPEGARTDEADRRLQLSKAYLRQRALQALRRFALPADAVRDYPARTGQVVPPLATLIDGVARCGFVTVEPDSDGVVRRIPLLARHGEAVYMQFGLALAAGELAHGQAIAVGADAASVRLIPRRGPGRVIPVDGEGFMLIDWVPASDTSGMLHLSAAGVVAIAQEQAKLRRHAALEHGLRVHFLAQGRVLPNAHLEKLYWQFTADSQAADQAGQRRLEAQLALLRAELYRPADVAQARAAFAQALAEEQALDRAVREAAAAIVAALRQPAHLEVFLGRPPEPTGPAATQPAAYHQELERFVQAKRRVQRLLALLDRLPEENRLIEANLARLLEQLRSRIAGKVCLVGSTATGAADFVPTPLGARTPGVVVHSNILNTILGERFIRPAPPLIQGAAIVGMGTVAVLLAATRPVIQAGLLGLALAGLGTAMNGFVVFGAWHTTLVVAAPLSAMLLGFLLVTACRQLTEERAKRQIRELFAQAMSPTLVDRLLEDPALAQLGGQKRRITCLFSDLAGFTALSERLGPAETVRLLNRYFDGMADVIQNRRGGYLNKFLGDGILALFGAPVGQEDHPARAIRAAIDCQAAVDRLNAALQAERGRDVHLGVRIGLSTGEAMVGNCGSSHRMDYTAIGDCVNTAARLEAANKFFGSRILALDQTWLEGADDDVLGRPLGLVYLTGRQEPLWIWEVIGRREAVAPEVGRAAADFAHALELFSQRQFAAAGRLLQQVQQVLGHDPATAMYLDLCRQGEALAPGQELQPPHSPAKGLDRIAWPWPPPAARTDRPEESS